MLRLKQRVAFSDNPPSSAAAPNRLENKRFGTFEHLDRGYHVPQRKRHTNANFSHAGLCLVILRRSRLWDANLAAAAGQFLWRNVLLPPSQGLCRAAKAA